jgi:hypothetical protein
MPMVICTVVFKLPKLLLLLRRPYWVIKSKVVDLQLFLTLRLIEVVAKDMDTYVRKVPLGVCASIAPFNFPA